MHGSQQQGWRGFFLSDTPHKFKKLAIFPPLEYMLLHLLLIDVMLFGIATKCSSSNWWSIHSWKACSGYSRQCLLVHLSRKALMLFESSSRKCNKMFILQLMVHPLLKSLLWLFEAKCARTLVGGLALVLFEWIELTDMQSDGHFNSSLSAVPVYFVSCILYFRVMLLTSSQ